jgi:hypothetical protein
MSVRKNSVKDAAEMLRIGDLRCVFGRFCYRVDTKLMALPYEAQDSVKAALKVGRRLQIEWRCHPCGRVEFTNVFDF